MLPLAAAPTLPLENAEHRAAQPDRILVLALEAVVKRGCLVDGLQCAHDG
jgi:hypothetical protein